jgi:hypothetical protein
MMENLKGRAALRRSKALVKRSLGTAVGVAFVHWAVPAFIGGIWGAVFGALFKASELPNAPELTRASTNLIQPIVSVLLVPLLATATALLYFKMRELGGEALEPTLSQIEQEELPRSRWQQRMRERLYSSTPSA